MSKTDWLYAYGFAAGYLLASSDYTSWTRSLVRAASVFAFMVAWLWAYNKWTARRATPPSSEP